MARQSKYNWQPLSLLSKRSSLRYSTYNSSCTSSLNLKPAAIVQLDFGSKTEKITVFKGDNIKELAENFCQQHSLTQECVDYIVQNIERELDMHYANTLLPTFGSKEEQQIERLSGGTTQAPQSLIESESEFTHNR